MDADDPGIAERVRARDPQTLQAVVHALLPQILRTARGAGLSHEAAEDVAQGTFLTFFESAHRFEGRSLVRTWVYGILYRKIAEARRKLGRDGGMEDVDEIAESRFAPDGAWSRPPRPVEAGAFEAEVRLSLGDCLEELPTAHRMAFLLREVEDLETPEICKILEVTRTNLGVLLHRARNRLRDCLERKGIER